MIMGGFLAKSCLTLIAALGLFGCADEVPDYRYRLTVEVETPEGTRSGSSVIEVQTNVASENAIPSPGLVSHEVRGEAVAVELPDEQVLFALLRSDSDTDWASRVMFMLAPKIGGENPYRNRFDAMLRDPTRKVVPRMWPAVGHLERRSAYPILVTFGDLSDPTSVEQVDPDDLASTFGEGVSLKRITVQLTGEPVTTGIEKKLGWLGMSFKGFAREDFPTGFPVRDVNGLFKKGDN
jgi:hypothetical protein